MSVRTHKNTAKAREKDRDYPEQFANADSRLHACQCIGESEASTRGDGDAGELITHNIPVFYNVPTRIPHKGRLVITGEGFIHKDDFEKMKDGAFGKVADSRGKLLEAIGDYGFDTCPFVFLPENATLREIEDRIRG